MPGTDIFDCRFLETDNEFGACSDNAVHFWTRLTSDETFCQRRGVFKQLSSNEVMTKIACVNGTAITGSTSGRLWSWEGRVCVKLAQLLHSGSVTCMHAPRTSIEEIGLCVSTHDGSVYLLNSKLEVLKRLMTNRSIDCRNRIDSIYWSDEVGRILVGKSSNLYEMTIIDEKDSSLVARGQSEIIAFAVNPVRADTIITVAKDGEVNVWDTSTHSVTQATRLESRLSCVAYSNGGDQIAIGFDDDGDPSSLKEVSFVVVDAQDLENAVHSGCNSQGSLTVCKYSNDDKFLVFGSIDMSIYIHLGTDKFPLVYKCRGHSGPVRSIDFGYNSTVTARTSFLRSCTSDEVLYWTIQGKQQTPLSQRGTKWESETCSLSWSLEGAHNLYKGSVGDIQSFCLYSSNHGDTALVGDSRGKLLSFHYPVADTHPLYLEYKGHSGSIPIILRSSDGTVYSISNKDSCILQWKTSDLTWNVESMLTIDHSQLNLVERTESALSSAPSKLDMDCMIHQLDELDFTSDVKTPTKSIPKQKPWMRSIVAPTNFSRTEDSDALPNGALSLERVHGYSGNGVKKNLHFLNDGNDVLYSVGKLLVRYNVKDDTQQFYNAGCKVTCLALHKCKSLCAVGLEGSASVSIQIIDLKTIRPLSFLGGQPKGVLCLDIDNSGKYIVSVGSHDQQLIVHDWQNRTIIATSQTLGQTLDLKFSKGSPGSFIQCGVNFVRCWSMNGSSLTFEVIHNIGNQVIAPLQQVYCCIGLGENEDILIGTSSGQLLKLVGRKEASKIAKAHSSAVTCIASTEGGFVTASNDGTVKVWNSSMRCITSINTESLGNHHPISSLCWHQKDSSILVGTNGSAIWNVSSSDGTNFVKHGGPLVSSHSSSPMGLSFNPNGFSFATCGEDGILRMWSLFDSSDTNVFDLTMPSRSCAFSPDGRMLAVGIGKPQKEHARTVNGQWMIVRIHDNADMQIIAERRDSRKHVTEIKWHGERIAVGTSDNKIYVYDITSKTKPATKVDINLLSVIDLSSSAKHLDFSRDGKYLRVNCVDYQLQFFEAAPGLQLKEASRLRDVTWETETCTLGWNVAGVWGTHEDTANVTTLDCNAAISSVVAGDSIGRIRMYRHPCSSTSAQYNEYSAHLGPIAMARWALGGSHLITTGETDNAVMIWKCNVDDAIQQATSGINDSIHNDKQISIVSDHENNGIGTARLGSQPAVYDSLERIVYPSSNAIVSFDRTKNQTATFQHHDMSISAMCVSKSRRLIASGDVDCNTVIWDSQNGLALASLSESRQRGGISILSFLSDETRLVSISTSEKRNTICIWTTLTGEWSDAYLHAFTLGGIEKAAAACFAPVDTRSSYSLVTSGRNYVSFWSDEQSNLVLSHRLINENVVSIAALNETIVTGTSAGLLLVWRDKDIVDKIHAHNRAVLQLITCPEGLVSASEGIVTLWSRALQRIASYEVATTQTICSLDICMNKSREATMKILVGTESTIYEISVVTGRVTVALIKYIE